LYRSVLTNIYFSRSCKFHTTSKGIYHCPFLSSNIKMSSGKQASFSSKSKDSAASKKSRGSDIHTALLGNAEQVRKSLEVLHVGKRLLLKADAIYGKKIPRGEEKYNFQYIVKSIDSNNTIATIEFERKYIEDHGTSFKVYPIIKDSDYEIDEYLIALIKEDSNLYNHYIAIANKEANNLHDLQDTMKAEEKRKSAVDTSDIKRKILEQKIAPYDVLLMEFESMGERVDSMSFREGRIMLAS
jgi:hypothetical protein